MYSDNRHLSDISDIFQTFIGHGTWHLQGFLGNWLAIALRGPEITTPPTTSKLPIYYPKDCPKNLFYLGLAGEAKKGLVGELAKRLVENQKRTLVRVKENPFISKREMADIIGISTAAIDKNIASLKKGLLKRIGPAKGGYWAVVEKR